MINLVRSGLSQLRNVASRAPLLHPIVWKYAWLATHHVKFLLPHDISYFAIRHFVKILPEGLFLDVGANDGISALSFRKFSRSYRIFSLEPNPTLEPSLRALRENDSLFDYKMVAVGSLHEKKTLYVPVYGSVAIHALSSLAEDQARNAVKVCFGPRIAAKTTVRAFDIDVVTIDDLRVQP